MARIRWEGDDRAGYLGYAGKVTADLFQLWVPTFSKEWTLTSSLAGLGAGHRPAARGLGYADNPDELKARAEELLAEFTASLGAVFPAAPGEALTADGTQCDQEIRRGNAGRSVQCASASRFVAERSDHDPSYHAAAGRAATEACEAHLASIVLVLMDGDDKMSVTVRARWDA